MPVLLVQPTQEVDYKIAFVDLMKFIYKLHLYAFTTHGYQHTLHHDIHRDSDGGVFILYHVFYRLSHTSIHNFYYFYSVLNNEIIWHNYDNVQPNKYRPRKLKFPDDHKLTYLDCALDRYFCLIREEQDLFSDFSIRCKASVEYDLVHDSTNIMDTISQPDWYVSEADRLNNCNKFKLD